EERPNVYHQHSWTRGLGAAHLRAAREAGLKTILTVHTPSSICIRGTMMLFGERACDGRIDPSRCGTCWSQGRGAPKAVADVLGGLPRAVGEAIEHVSFVADTRLATALSARRLGEHRSQEFLRMVNDADRIVSVCGWLHDALELNQVPPEKLILSR